MNKIDINIFFGYGINEADIFNVCWLCYIIGIIVSHYVLHILLV